MVCCFVYLKCHDTFSFRFFFIDLKVTSMWFSFTSSAWYVSVWGFESTKIAITKNDFLYIQGPSIDFANSLSLSFGVQPYFCGLLYVCGTVGISTVNLFK